MSSLILYRKPRQAIVLALPGGLRVVISNHQSAKGGCKFRVEAPKEVKVLRQELEERTEQRS